MTEQTPASTAPADGGRPRRTFKHPTTKHEIATSHPVEANQLKAQGYVETTPAKPAEATQAEPPKGNAGRDEWAAYADTFGVTYPEDAGRDEIKAAVDAAS